MKILIIEDEFRNYNCLRRMLTAYDSTMTIEGPLESVAEARQWLAVHQGTAAPDLVFADIRLSDGISFDALDICWTMPQVWYLPQLTMSMPSEPFNTMDWLI